MTMTMTPCSTTLQAEVHTAFRISRPLYCQTTRNLLLKIVIQARAFPSSLKLKAIS